MRTGWLCVWGWSLTAACVHPEEAAPINPPPGAETMILVAQGPRENKVEVFEAPFPTHYSQPVDAELRAFFYRCAPAALQLGGEGARLLPLPETEAGQRLDGNRWRPLSAQQVREMRGQSPVVRQEQGCINLTVRRQLHEPSIQGTTAAAWLEPQRGVVVVLDDQGGLWRADPGWSDGGAGVPRLDVISPLALRVVGISYSKLDGRTWGFGQDQVSDHFVTFSLAPDGTVTREAEQPAPPDSTLDGPNQVTQLVFSETSPLEAFAVGRNAAVSWYQEGSWSRIAEGQQTEVQTALLVLGPGRLLVAGQCAEPANDLDTDVKGCRELLRLERQGDGSWSTTPEPLPAVGGWVSALVQDGSGSVYAGTRKGEFLLRGPAGGWTQLEGTGGLGRIEYLAALPVGAVAAIDGGGLYRVGAPEGTCPSLAATTEHRGLLGWGTDFALVGETKHGGAVDLFWGSGADEDCRLPLLPQGE